MPQTMEVPECSCESFSCVSTGTNPNDIHLLLKLLVVERVVWIQDCQLIILCTVLVEQKLSQEGEVLRMPDVHCVARAKRNPDQKL